MTRLFAYIVFPDAGNPYMNMSSGTECNMSDFDSYSCVGSFANCIVFSSFLVLVH